ncbi:MAG: phosphatidate cytidylyltransferase [Rhizobiaceae bacterium]|nr:phosphatidate cytidylyltransferase [Rhizobiaceae bacterium]
MNISEKTGGSELQLRIVFGLLLAAFAFFQTWLGGLAFSVFVAIIAIIMFFEFRRICGVALPGRVAFFAYAFLLLIGVAWIGKAYDTALVLTGFAFLSLWAWEALIKRTGWAALGLVYVLLPFFALTHLRSSSPEGFYVILLLFACVWGADTVAYIAGKTIGGPKLAPRISPGKTWSGFFGGLVGGIVIAWLVMKISGYALNPAFFLVAALLVIASQLGDLAESALKRKFGVKDSGAIIPGHGGVLDRIDGLVFTAVVAWLLAMQLSGIFFGVWTWEPANAFLTFITVN